MGLSSNYYNMNMFNTGISGGYGFGSSFGDSFGTNMFGNIFGMGNSDNYFNQQAAFGVANTIFNTIGMAISCETAKSRANSREAYEAKLDKIEAKIEKLEKKYTFKNGKIDTTEANEEVINTTKTYNDAEDAYKKNQNIIKEFTDNDQTLITAWETKSEEEKKNEPNGKTNYDAAIARQNNANNAKNNTEKLKKAMDKAEKEMNAAKEALDKAQEDAAKAEEEYADLLEEQQEILDIINDKILDKADGHSYQQTKAKDLDKKLSKNQENKYTVTGEVKKGDLRAAIQAYRNASSDDQKADCAARFMALYDAADPKDIDKYIKAAMEIISEE